MKFSSCLMPIDPEATDYGSLSRGPLYSLVFIAPFLIGYEINAIFYGVDIVARSDLQQFLYDIWPGAEHLSALVIAAVLISWQCISKASWRIRPELILLMAGESLLWALPILGMAILGSSLAAATACVAGVAGVTGVAGVAGAAVDLVAGGLFQTVMTRIGGGIYEEFIFRLAAFNLLAMVFFDMLKTEDRRVIWVILAITAFAFAWQHFPGMTAIDWPIFIFYTLCGAYLGCVYLLRGFGLAVGAHIFYNIIVTIMQHSSGQLA